MISIVTLVITPLIPMSLHKQVPNARAAVEHKAPKNALLV